MVTKPTTRTATRKRTKDKNNLPDKNVLELPVLPIRNTVLLPNIVTPLIVGREQSVKAIEDAISKDRTLFVVAQVNEELEDPGPADLYTVGVEGMIDRVLKLPAGSQILLSPHSNHPSRCVRVSCKPSMSRSDYKRHVSCSTKR